MASDGLTVAVTGSTGDLGIGIVNALERSRSVKRIEGIVTRVPLVPDSVAWIHSVKKPVLTRNDRARRLLRWHPRHTARATLEEMVAAHRAQPPAR